MQHLGASTKADTDSRACNRAPLPTQGEDMKTILYRIRYHYAMWRHQRKFGKFPPIGF